MCELHETTGPAVGRRTLIRGAGRPPHRRRARRRHRHRRAGRDLAERLAGRVVVGRTAQHPDGRRRDLPGRRPPRRRARRPRLRRPPLQPRGRGARQGLVLGPQLPRHLRQHVAVEPLERHGHRPQRAAPPTRLVGHLHGHAALAHPLDPQLLQRGRALGRRLLGPQGRDALRDQRASRRCPARGPRPAIGSVAARRRRPSRGRRSGGARAASASTTIQHLLRQRGYSASPSTASFGATTAEPRHRLPAREGPDGRRRRRAEDVVGARRLGAARLHRARPSSRRRSY